MTQKKQKKNKNLFFIIVIVLIISIIGGYFAMKLLNNNKQDKEEASIYTEQEGYKDDSENEEDIAEKAVQDKKVVQYEGEDPNSSDILTGVVTYAAVNDNNLIIRTNINQYITNGTCGLTLLRGGVIIYDSIANIVGNVSTSTCEGFDIPVTELGGGAVEININLSDGERSGVIRGEVNI